MPKINEYTNTQDLNASPVEGAAMSMLRLGRMQESAIQETGANATHIVDQVEHQRAQSETTRLATQMAAANSQFFDDWEKTKANADPNDPNVAKNFIDQHVRPTLDGMNEGLYTTQGKDMLAKMTANMTNEWHERAGADQARMTSEAAVNSWQMMQDSATKSAYLDPTSADRQIELMQTGLAAVGASHNVPRAKVDEAVTKASTQVQYAQGLGMIDKNARAALPELQDGSRFQNLSGAQTAELIERAKEKIKTDTDKQLGADRVTFEDAAARMHDFGSWGPNGEQYTRDQAEALGGDNPGERARMGQLWDVANAAGKENANANSQDMSLADQQKHALSVAAAAPSSPDYHAGAAAAKAAAEAYTRRSAAFKKDPNAYVSQKSPYVAQAWQAFAQAPSPERYQEAVTMSVAEQKRIDPTATPRVVPTEVAAQIKQSLGAMDQEGGPERAAQTLGTWQNTIGPNYWPQAVSELRGQHILSAEQSVAANLASEGKAGMASDLLSAAGLKDKDLSPSSTHSKNVSNSVARALKPLQDSLAYDPGGGAYMRDQIDAYTKLALFEQRKNPNASVSDIVNNAVMNNYQFKGTMRIPQGINAGIVSKGARQIQAGLTQDKIAGLADASSVRANGHWVTLSGDTGMRLVDDAGRQVFEKKGTGSLPIQRTWAELTTQMKPGPEAPVVEDSVQDTVRAAAKSYGVPEHIALGLVEQESRFDPNAVSPTGARGLGQLTRPFIADYGVGLDPTTPSGNAAISMRGLAALKTKYGSWETALKHYGDPAQTTYSDEVMARAKKYQ